jgi:hypothetical protein
MTVATIQLSESLQALIDARLDTIDRMLLGRVPRQDRLDIVKEVEAQVFELLQERGGEELGRDDVLAVLARLDPPEAYLPEDAVEQPVSPRTRSGPRVTEPVRRADARIAKASGILGLLTMTLVPLFFVVGYLLAVASSSELLFFVFGVMSFFLTLAGGTVGIVLGVQARRGGEWAVVGIVTGALSLVCSFAGGTLLLVLAVG